MRCLALVTLGFALDVAAAILVGRSFARRGLRHTARIRLGLRAHW